MRLKMSSNYLLLWRHIENIKHAPLCFDPFFKRGFVRYNFIEL